MAKYDYGHGCPCGLYSECPPQCKNYSPTIIVEKVIMKKEEIEDFGFSFVDSNEMQAKQQLTENKLEGLRNMIMPLLNNLMKNPEKDTILWPNRDKKIKEFIKKMDEYINS